MRRRCGPDCVTIVSGTNRDKWDYVRGLYFEIYSLPDPREVSDPARVAEEAAMTALFNSEEAAWLANYSSTPFEYWLQWKYERGTEVYGNLPQHKVSEHEGHTFVPCPYSTECSDLRSEHLLGSVPTKVTHTIGGITHYMVTAQSGKWGFMCMYDGCPYYLATGERYFYC